MNLLEFSVTGIDYDGRDKVLKGLARELEEMQGFDNNELYEGYSNKEIKDNLDYNQKIYKYGKLVIDYVQLLPDDENEYDKNAVKVLIGNEEDDLKFIGYVPKGKAKKVRTLLEDKEVVINAELYGGKFKYLDTDDEGEDVIENDFMEYKVWIEIDKYIPKSTNDQTEPLLKNSEQIKESIIKNKKSNTKNNVAILGFFLGWLGIHNFIYGYYTKGLIQLAITVFSFGYLGVVSGIWAIIESILILQDKIKPNENKNKFELAIDKIFRKE